MKIITKNLFKMKYIKYLFLILFTVSCEVDLDETPPFLDDTMYSDPQSAQGARDGLYQALTTYNTQERRIFVVNGHSGLLVTGKGGNRLNSADNSTLFKLDAGYHGDVSALWGGLYQAISRTNSAIINTPTVTSPSTDDEKTLNDVAGHAYLVRAWSYFSLVRLWGEIPLWLELPSSGNTSKALSSQAEVYTQIVSDAKRASELLNGAAGTGYPRQYAANMLLAKVYMTMATNSNLGTGTWQMAYDEAKKVYGQYSLVADYGSLFTSTTENTSESIFELQISETATNSQMGRNFSPWKWKKGFHFGWLRVNAFFHDYHAKTYGVEDKRYASTYLSSYSRADNGKPVKVYPGNPGRGRFAASHPYLFKFAEKDTSHAAQFNSQNIIIYRYADLLLMLAEISNELGNGEAMTYLQPVLDRAGVTARPEYSEGQAAFRNAIMDEYKFELLGEGEDAHNNRRRGYQYFLDHTITPHNSSIGTKVWKGNKKYAADRDMIYETDETKIMKLKIPISELNTNDLID